MRARIFSTPTVIVFALILAGCSGDGTSLREPGTGGATPRPAPVTEIDEGSDLDVAFTLQSPAFAANGTIPARHTADGADVSPPLEWINQPTDALELALVVTDPTADGFVHWVIWGLDATSTGLGEGQVPPGAVEALNGFGDLGWAGPSPPVEDDPHVYLFRLFALRDVPVEVTPGIAGRDAITMLESHAMAIAELLAFYP